MPNTITNYNVFVANTKARAQEVNENFANHRGDLVPIETNTATASNLSHALGQSDHRWTTGYIRDLALGSTSTSWTIQDSTAAVGKLEFLINGATAAALSTTGWNNDSVIGPTFFSSANTTTSFTAATNIIDLTVTTTNKPVKIYCGSKSNGSGQGYFSWTTGAIMTVNLLRDGSTIQTYKQHLNSISGVGSVGRYEARNVWFIDDSAPAGTTVVYRIRGAITAGFLGVNTVALFGYNML